MNIWVNMIIEWVEGEGGARVERVLWTDPSGEDVVMIDLQHPQALPIWQKRTAIEVAVGSNKARILELDPYAQLYHLEEAIPESHRRRRNQAWLVIKPLVEESGGDIFVPAKRGPLVAAAVARSGQTKTTIYRYLRRYWQGGQTKNALLPHFHQSGGKGQARKSGQGKRGRRSNLTRATHEPTGVNVDSEIQEHFRRGIALFYENRAGRSLSEAFQLTLERFFHRGYELREGVLVPILPPADELPTLRQFRYWYEKGRDPVEAITARVGSRQFTTRYRAVLGDSTQMAFGPGSLSQFDATLGDIYLVSSLDPSRLIGRPVIYVVIDVFSRLIVGFSVSLEGPSWLGAMLALENATDNKVTFCAEYGITISEADWPSHYLPRKILADRGELETGQADNLVNGLNVQVANTAPYRADWKGIVEQNFRLSNDKLIRWLPGAVYPKRDKAGSDYRLDACLNLYQFRQLMIRCILHHNHYHRMGWYRLDEFMITDHVAPYPIELWRWGLQNRVGHLRSMAPDLLRLNLLPREAASVTPAGILFRGLRYTAEVALREQWFVRARERGRWRVEVSYDPRKLDVIYLHLESDQRLEPCYLNDSDRSFRGRDWQETLDYLALQKQAAALAKSSEQQALAEFHAHVNQIVAPAQEQAAEAVAGQSKRARLQGIKENRKQERARERETGAWDLSEEPGETNLTPSTGSSEATDRKYIPPPRHLDKLRQGRQERLSHES